MFGTQYALNARSPKWYMESLSKPRSRANERAKSIFMMKCFFFMILATCVTEPLTPMKTKRTKSHNKLINILFDLKILQLPALKYQWWPSLLTQVQFVLQNSCWKWQTCSWDERWILWTWPSVLAHQNMGRLCGRP